MSVRTAFKALKPTRMKATADTLSDPKLTVQVMHKLIESLVVVECLLGANHMVLDLIQALHDVGLLFHYAKVLLGLGCWTILGSLQMAITSRLYVLQLLQLIDKVLIGHQLTTYCHWVDPTALQRRLQSILLLLASLPDFLLVWILQCRGVVNCLLLTWIVALIGFLGGFWGHWSIELVRR